MTGSMTTLLACLLLFSCKDGDLLDSGSNSSIGKDCDHICFGISGTGNPLTRGAVGTDKQEHTAGRFVLRSADSPDTLCVRATVSDGIGCSSFSGETPVTRSAPVSSLSEYGVFHVQAHCKEGGTLVNTFYMDDSVTYRTGNWSTENVYYWPGAARTLQFFAWAPVDAGLTAPEGPGSTALVYAVPETVDMQKDLVVATTDEIEGNRNEVVPLGFNHICTAVRFVTGSRMQPGTIRSVALKGVRYKGSYDMATEKWTQDNDTADFTQSLDKEMSGNETDGTAVATNEATFMMLPQESLPEGAVVEVVFADSTGAERTLSASVAGMEWPQGKTVAYKLSVSPEYELEFISEPKMQDAHYVICPIKIKVGHNVPGGWTLTSTDPENVTLRTDLTVLTRRGFWVEEDRGSASINGTTVGDDITVYAFLTENAGEETREIDLELRPTDMPEAPPATFTISQLCPSWNGVLGCERFEEYDEGYSGYPWGFLWDSDMKITYDAEEVPVSRRIVLFFHLGLFNNDDFVKQDISLVPYYHHIVIDFSKISPLDVASSPDDGVINTWEVYNFDGIHEASSIMEMLEEWGIHPDKELPANPTLFAARMCALKNKFNKEVVQEQGQTVERAILKRENLVWYLPAMNEAPKMKDNAYPLDNGDYWTSTAIDDGQNAYKYTVGGVTSSEIRTSGLRVRAVRKK